MSDTDAKQLSFNLSHDQSLHAEEYIIVPSNQHLVDQLMADDLFTSPLTILFGEDKSGKSHLAHVWLDEKQGQILPDQFLNIQDDQFPELAELVGRAPILVDDIDKKLSCETTLFHIINLCIQKRVPILLTSKKPLMCWEIELPDLLSRLKAGKHLEIAPIDDFLLEQILIKTFAEKQLNVAENVINYILPRVDRSIKSVLELVDQLDQQALVENRAITRNMVGKIFEKQFEQYS